MFGLFGGFKTIKDIANEIGVDHRLFGSALTEMRVNYAIVKRQKKFFLKEHGEHQANCLLAISLIPTALEGLATMQQKFGGQPEIGAARLILKDYVESNQDMDSQ